MEFYLFNSNIDILKAWIKSQPREGYGVANKLAIKLNISTVLMSQILSETRNLQLEKAFELADIMSLDPNEKEYFLTLTELQNAGTEKLRKYFQNKVSILKAKFSEVKENVRNEKVLSESAKALFYSNWLYSAIRLSTDISETKTVKALADKFQISIDEVSTMLEFLVEHGLCIKIGNQYSMGVKNTHLGTGSPWLLSRQLQWRMKAQQSMEKANSKNLFYTGPMVLSKNDIEKIHTALVKMIKDCTEIARDSDSQKLYCLNIDWFEV